MSLYADSRNPDREIERALISLRVKEFQASGGQIEELPHGATAFQQKSLKQVSKDLYERHKRESKRGEVKRK